MLPRDLDLVIVEAPSSLGRAANGTWSQALRETEAGRRLAPVADDVATALAPAVAASRLAWRSVAAAATAAARGDGAAPGPYS